MEIEGELVKPPSAKQDIELSAKKVTVVGPTDPLVNLSATNVKLIFVEIPPSSQGTPFYGVPQRN